MLKHKGRVVTREQLNKAKELHTASYNEFVERRRMMYNAQAEKAGLVNAVIFATKAMKISRPKSMRQCVTQAIIESEITVKEITDNQ